MSVKTFRPFIYIVFFLSGLAGLIYQIVWTRMLYFIFGVSTTSVVAVTSAFMAGLALGSFLSGKISPKRVNILKFYAVIELTIGLTAIILPFIFEMITHIYTIIYHSNGSAQFILVIKFVLTFITILIPTTAMGATLPALIEFIQRHSKTSLSLETGILYAVNTFGAAAGVLLSGFVLIELLGLLTTMWVAIVINLVLAVFIWLISSKKSFVQLTIKSDTPHSSLKTVSLGIPLKLALIIFALSGAVSMIYEIAWIRLLTPLTGTFIYAFSFILALILLGIALGSFISKFLIGRFQSPYLLFSVIEFAIGIGAVLSVLVTTDIINLPTILTELLVLIPATLAMGMTFPIVMKLAPAQSHGSTFAGTSYSFNTIGSMLGPLLGGFILLPLFGSSETIITLACFNFFFAILLILSDLSIKKSTRDAFVFAAIGIILFLSLAPKFNHSIFTDKKRKEMESLAQSQGYAYRYLEDETASVIALKSPTDTRSGLLVDGIGMTSLVEETKFMAHLPILIHPDPKDMLIICFGMGTTFRSAITYGINVDAVELVPSVPKMFTIFFPDAQDVLNNPKGKIIINDGRNYVRLTQKKYDIIQVDPPPPVNAAGTTVLYSKEFYQDSKKILKDKGLFIQWFLAGSKDQDINMLIKSFVDVFPYVKAFNSPNGIGIHMIGSNSPINIDETMIKQRLLDNPKAFADLNEWSSWDSARIIGSFAGDKDKYIAQTANVPPVTDNFPRTEYFLLRHNFGNFLLK